MRLGGVEYHISPTLIILDGRKKFTLLSHVSAMIWTCKYLIHFYFDYLILLIFITCFIIKFFIFLYIKMIQINREKCCQTPIHSYTLQSGKSEPLIFHIFTYLLSFGSWVWAILSFHLRDFWDVSMRKNLSLSLTNFFRPGGSFRVDFLMWNASVSYQSEFSFSCVVNSQSFFASTPQTIRFTLLCVELQFKIKRIFWASTIFLRPSTRILYYYLLANAPSFGNYSGQHVLMLPILQVAGIWNPGILKNTMYYAPLQYSTSIAIAPGRLGSKMLWLYV